MPASRLVRGADWPPELHRACNRMEAARDRLVDARTADELEAALSETQKAERAFGALTLALDKRRRPEIYRR